MEMIDRGLQQRVWQRVAEGRKAAWDAEALRPLIAGELAASAALLRIAQRDPGRKRALLRVLSGEKQRSSTFLKGIYRALTGRSPQVTPAPLPRLPRKDLLMQCHWQQQKLLEALQHWTQHPTFGKSFDRLYQQALAQNHALLELLGDG